jgi:hypothetical protein
MNEPIEHLIANMSSLSRPVSSKHMGIASNDYIGVGNRGKRRGAPSLKALKKERAMTAHHKLGQMATSI